MKKLRPHTRSKRSLKTQQRQVEEQEQAATKTSATDEEFNAGNYTFEVTEDTDTRDNSKIYLVKVAEKLSREEYLQMNKHIKSLGGYYSKFKHAFLFKDDPTEILKGEKIESMTESAENIRAEQTEQAVPAVSYTIRKKTVVNEFDGNETEYNKTMKNRKYYLFDSNKQQIM